MPCLIALVVLSVLGIFSASHRTLAREAFDCVFRRIRLRPCTTGFDTKVKVAVLGPLLSRSPKLARFVSRHFEALSYVLIVSMTLSFLWSARGIYNYWAWGHCDGQFASGGFCVFDPAGTHNEATGANGAHCTDQKLASQALSTEGIPLEMYPVMKQSAKTHTSALFVGCYSCDFTRKVYPSLKRVIDSTSSSVRFAHFSTKKESAYLLPYDVCVARIKPDSFPLYVDQLFNSTKEEIATSSYVHTLIYNLGISEDELTGCLDNPETISLVQKQQQGLQSMRIYGTPTVFIDETALVGPKPERVYRRLLNHSWF